MFFLEGSILILLLFNGVQFLINKFQLKKSNIIQNIFAPVTDLHIFFCLKKLHHLKKWFSGDLRYMVFTVVYGCTFCTSTGPTSGILGFLILTNLYSIHFFIWQIVLCKWRPVPVTPITQKPHSYKRPFLTYLHNKHTLAIGFLVFFSDLPFK